MEKKEYTAFWESEEWKWKKEYTHFFFKKVKSEGSREGQIEWATLFETHLRDVQNPSRKQTIRSVYICPSARLDRWNRISRASNICQAGFRCADWSIKCLERAVVIRHKGEDVSGMVKSWCRRRRLRLSMFEQSRDANFALGKQRNLAEGLGEMHYTLTHYVLCWFSGARPLGWGI